MPVNSGYNSINMKHPMEANLTSGATDLAADLEVRFVAFSLRREHLHVLLAPAAALAERWELPGAPFHPNLSVEETAASRLETLTGVRESYLEQLYTYGEPGRYPGGKSVSVAYFALVPADMAESQPLNQDAAPARWFPADQIPALAGDHTEILAYAIRRLRYKLEYSAVGFQLLPETFTLTELQKTYEMILGEELDKRNFRRRILEADIIEETDQFRIGEGRPARLFRYRPDAVAEVKTRRLFP